MHLPHISCMQFIIVTVNVGRAGAASMDVIQVQFSDILTNKVRSLML